MTENHQNVTAINGTAIGVIGADLHVFGDGVPVYLLRNWAPDRRPDPAWLREVPSRLLNAHHAVVGFTGRDGELERLRSWRDGRPRLAVRWLHAPGGQGKTRLAEEFAARSAADGWKVITAADGPATVVPGRVNEDLTTDGYRGVLVLVDYADRWPLSHLRFLFSNRLFHRTGRPARILLIARTLDALPSVRQTLAGSPQIEVSDQFLDPLPELGDDRAEMFGAARDAFATAYEVAGGPDVPGPDLTDPALGLTLTLHLAALVAVDAHATGRIAPTRPEELSGYLLDREYAHWAGRRGDGTHVIDPAADPFRSPPEEMHRVVYAAALSGPVSPETGGVIVGATIPHREPGVVLADHAACYPPATGGTVLEPLYPDRLAEDLVALSLPGHRVGFPARDWSGPDSAALLGAGTRTRELAPRALGVLAAAAQRWPHVATGLLNPLLHDDPALALEAGSDALVSLAAGTAVTDEVLERVAGHFPAVTGDDRAPGIAAVRLRITPVLLSRAGDDRDEQAWTNFITSRWLSAAGRWAEAEVFGERACEIMRPLADADPERHRRPLAAFLSCLSDTLSALERLGRSVEVAEEAVALLRQGDTDDDLFGLAETRYGMATDLFALGREDEALAATGESLTILRRLAEKDPEEWAEPLAAGLLTYVLAHTSDKAMPGGTLLELTDEAIAIRRARADGDDPGRRAALARALSVRSSVLLRLARPEEAYQAILEALPAFRERDAANPGAFRVGLSEALSDVARYLAAMGRFDDAAGPAREGVALARKAAAAGFARAQSNLADRLLRLGDVYKRLGRIDEALAATGEAVEFYRAAAIAEPGTLRADLSRALNDHAGVLNELFKTTSETGPLLTEMSALRDESLVLMQDQASGNPETNGTAVIEALAAMLADTRANMFPENVEELPEEQVSEMAIRYVDSSLKLLRLMAGTMPFARPPLATQLATYAFFWAGTGNLDEAAVHALESVRLFESLGTAGHGEYQPQLAEHLGAVTDALAEAERAAEAVVIGQFVMHLLIHLARRHPAPDLGPVMAGAVDQVERLIGADLLDEAIDLMEDCVRLIDDANPTEASKWGMKSVGAQFVRLDLLCRRGRTAEAVAAAERLVPQARQATSGPGELFPILVMAAVVHLAAGDHDSAWRLAQEGAAIARKDREPHELAHVEAVAVLAEVAAVLGRRWTVPLVAAEAGIGLRALAAEDDPLTYRTVELRILRARLLAHRGRANGRIRKVAQRTADLAADFPADDRPWLVDDAARLAGLLLAG